MTIDAQLRVGLKGTDLFASTAFLTLTRKMGYTDRLVGLKRFDYFQFAIEVAIDVEAAITRVKKSIDRQSTFYNRNKHLSSLECHWQADDKPENGLEGEYNIGHSRADFERVWLAQVRNHLKTKTVKDLDGKPATASVILGGSRIYLAEVLIEDEDTSGRDTVAAKLGVGVTCRHRAALWWLALSADSEGEARQLAEEIAVTRRRDSGLLFNPNFQHADFVSVKELRLDT